jgi:hypothetical protein
MPFLASDAPSVTAPAARWEALFGSVAPRKQPLVAQAVAWKEQVLLHGDVAPHIQRDLDIAARHVADARGRAQSAVHTAGQGPGSDGAHFVEQSLATQPLAVTAAPANVVPGAAQSAPHAPARRRRPETAALPPASSQLLPGTRLVKSYGGRNHVVEVTGDGFLYEGTVHASLSALAKHITGTHWNGLLFFGLRKRKVYPAKVSANG